MGRIKTALIKRASKKLYSLYKEKFEPTFDGNKVLVKGYLPEANKKLRNIVAGYITRMVKKQQGAI